jgi:hypothetical protein
MAGDRGIMVKDDGNLLSGNAVTIASTARQ